MCRSWGIRLERGVGRMEILKEEKGVLRGECVGYRRVKKGLERRRVKGKR